MKKVLGMVLILALAWLVSAPGWAQTAAGKFTELQGSVTVKKPNGQMIKAVLKGMVTQGDEVKTDKNSKATILFQDGSVLRLGPTTTVKINKLVYQQDKGIAQSAYEVVGGTIMSVVGGIFGGSGNSYQVRTPTAVSGVRGTMFIVKVVLDPATGQYKTVLASVEGTVHFAGLSGGQYDVNGHQYSTAGGDGVAQPPAPLSDVELQQLMDEVTAQLRSLDDRAGGLRQQGMFVTLKNGIVVYIPPELLLPKGDNGGNPEDLSTNQDNPADLIYEEPPQATELILTINIGPPS